MPINIVYGSFEHFALCATLFEQFAAGRISWIAGNHRHGRAMQATWVKAAVADRKSYTLDRRATAICRRCHRDTCRASIGWRTGQSTSQRLYSPLTPLFSYSAFRCHYFLHLPFCYSFALCIYYSFTLLFFTLLFYSSACHLLRARRRDNRHTWNVTKSQQKSPSNLTKYCARSEKWLSRFILAWILCAKQGK